MTGRLRVIHSGRAPLFLRVTRRTRLCVQMGCGLIEEPNYSQRKTLAESAVQSRNITANAPTSVM
jgi:hypothetical protein